MDGEAIAQAFATCSGLDCLRRFTKVCYTDKGKQCSEGGDRRHGLQRGQHKCCASLMV